MPITPNWITRRPAKPFFDPMERIWKISRYTDVATVLHSPQAGVLDASEELERLGQLTRRSFPHTANLFKGILFFQNPPFHTNGRNFLRAGFRLNASFFSAPAITTVVQELLTPLVEQPGFDAISQLCKKLPAQVMLRALGFATDTNECLIAASDPLMRLWSTGLPISRYTRGEQIARTAEELLVRDIRLARQTGSGRLASWVTLSDCEYSFADHELGGFLFFLFLAGIETTAAFLGNALGVLMHYPDEIEHLRQDPKRMAPVIDELLRFAGPSRWMSYRVFPSEIAIEGMAIPAGAPIGCEIEIAHHDPDVYSDPHLFNPERKAPTPLSFGAGIHACLGANLAKLETATLLQELIRSFHMQPMHAELQWENHPFLRRQKELPLRLSPIS